MAGIRITRDLIRAGQLLNIEVLDHVIVGHGKHSSLNFQPQLNLVYNTGKGNGLFGLGWSLSIPEVTRNTSKGVPKFSDSEDTFILSDAEDLVPIERSEKSTRYRPRAKGMFARILDRHDAV